jgi:hypothetical protein
MNSKKLYAVSAIRIVATVGLAVAMATNMLPVRASLTPTAQADSQMRFGPSVGGLALAISLDATSVRVGSPLEVHITIKNVGSKSVFIHRLGYYKEYRFDLVSDQGIPAEQNSSPRMAASFSATGWPLKPGQSYTHSFDLGQIFNLSPSTSYRLSVSSDIEQQFQSTLYATLKSNSVEFRTQ